MLLKGVIIIHMLMKEDFEMKKKIILKIIEDHPEIAVLFYELINVVNSCNKNQFMEFSLGKETNFDVALPQEWFN